MAVLFLPGTIIHEFSHAIMAKLLFVHVGRMELIPQLQGNSLKLGSVEVGQTDFVRNFLIGIAPFITGTALLLGILYYSFSNSIFGFNFNTFVLLYFIFLISNTMYSSKKDMEGAIEFFIALIIPSIFLYFIGIRLPDFSYLESYFRQGAILLSIPLFLDLALVIFGKIVNKR